LVDQLVETVLDNLGGSQFSDFGHSHIETLWSASTFR